MSCPLCGSKTAQLSLQIARPKRGNIKAAIRETIDRAGAQGLTVDDLERLLSVKHQSVSARVNELWNEGAITWKRWRENPSGIAARVWCVTDRIRLKAAQEFDALNVLHERWIGHREHGCETEEQLRQYLGEYLTEVEAAEAAPQGAA